MSECDLPRGTVEEPVAEEVDVVDDVAEEGCDEQTFPANQVGRVHHDQSRESGRQDLNRKSLFVFSSHILRNDLQTQSNGANQRSPLLNL